MDTEITHHSNDILMKCMAENFKDKTLAFFGLKTPRIAGLSPTALPAIEARETRTDIVFLLEDDTLLHLEFQTTVSKEDMKRFMLYDARITSREEHARVINTAVIYSGNIQQAPEILDCGSIFYRVTNVYMKDYDGDAEYKKLHQKITAEEILDEEDLMKLVFLPLMKSRKKIEERAVQSLELARRLKDDKQRVFAMSGIIVVTDKHLTEEYKKRLMEVLQMTQIEQWIKEEGREEGKKEGKKEREKEIARTALKEGAEVEFVVKITGLDKQIVLKLKEELN
jgi:predicted transposase/invertase (TIGR01784 family)